MKVKGRPQPPAPLRPGRGRHLGPGEQALGSDARLFYAADVTIFCGPLEMFRYETAF